MIIQYILKEGLSGFKRARLAMSASIITITAALVLLGLFGIAYLNTSQIVQSFRDRVEMEVFLSEPVADSTVAQIDARIKAATGVAYTKFITKDSAAQIFKEEFGEDIHGVLDFNPLPPSFKIYLREGYKNADSAAVVVASLKQIEGIDDIIYRKTLLELLDKRTRTFIMASTAVGFALCITALLLVSNTIRLIIYSKRQIITTMKLVGATRMYIRLPFFIEGILQGAGGGLIACGLLYVLATYISRWLGSEFAEFLVIPPFAYAIIACMGIVLGFAGSALSVRKFISEKVGN
ncbi:MAG TPA: permease-like cell division protein FtsX [Bacteroidota bacterium]|nr:permease-like cell division protein FtsX [Bacteroidota bacterium]